MKQHTRDHAHKGARHWLLQRATAIALAPLSLWFVFSILGRVDAPAQVATEWIANPAVAAGLIFYLAAAFSHAQLGLRVIAEDYIAAEKLRMRVVRILCALNIFAALIAIAATLRIAFF